MTLEKALEYLTSLVEDCGDPKIDYEALEVVKKAMDKKVLDTNL